MPITPTLELPQITNDAFSDIDRVVMPCAYAAQNKFGRYFDERIYENDLAARLRAEGLNVQTQVPLHVTHGSFHKTYYLDLVVNGLLYELKAVATLRTEHEAQALHYAMLQNTRLVKLLNFGESKVRGKLLSNALNSEARHQPELIQSDSRFMTPQCKNLFHYLHSLVRDLGTHLSGHLYNEAVIHHLGGVGACIRRVDVRSGDSVLGTHSVHSHAPGHCFVISALTRNQMTYRRHLEVLLEHSSVEGIQWINLNNSRIEFTTLEKP